MPHRGIRIQCIRSMRCPIHIVAPVDQRPDPVTLGKARGIGRLILEIRRLQREKRSIPSVLGLTLGACASVSMKTTLLLLALVFAGLGVLLLAKLAGRRIDAGPYLKSALLVVLGILVVPGILVCVFAKLHALSGPGFNNMYYCVIRHNSVPHLGKWNKLGFHLFYFPISIPILLGAGWALMKTATDFATGARRALLLLTFGFFVTLLNSYWPLITAQDYLPVLPLAVILAAGGLFAVLDLIGAPGLTAAAIGLVLAGELADMWHWQSPFDNEMKLFTGATASILRLTDPDDLVMDGKGESIYRKRPIYWVLEGITITRIQAGLIPDDVIPRMIATNTCVALDHRMRKEDKDWLRQNFMDGENKIWIAGKNLGPAKPEIVFENQIAADYSFVSDKGGRIAGTLDGKPLVHSQFIPAGRHELRLDAGGSGNVAFLWAKAVDRGFDPFAKNIKHS